ncbi:MAG: hypothetical protein WC842_01015 [Candidatus Paceibacterota bacterium]|jgi:hypothetical protein
MRKYLYLLVLIFITGVVSGLSFRYITQNGNILGAIIIAIIIFSLQRIIENQYLKPINNQKKIVEEIAVDLIKYANFYGNTIFCDIMKEEYKIASSRIRELSALLQVKTSNINFYSFFYIIKLIKMEKEDALKAGTILMALSNSFFDSETSTQNTKNAEQATEIRKLLNISEFKIY